MTLNKIIVNDDFLRKTLSMRPQNTRRTKWAARKTKLSNKSRREMKGVACLPCLRMQSKQATRRTRTWL